MLPAVRIASVNPKSASARLLKNAWSRARKARRLASGVCTSATDSWHASSPPGSLREGASSPPRLALLPGLIYLLMSLTNTTPSVPSSRSGSGAK